MFAAAYIPPQYSVTPQVEVQVPYTLVQETSLSLRVDNRPLINTYLRYQSIVDSFMDNGGKKASKEEYYVFDVMAQAFRFVPFNKVRVEYSSVLERVQFACSFTNGMRVSFGKQLDNASSEVFFSLSIDNEVLVVDKKSVEDLKDALLETIKA